MTSEQRRSAENGIWLCAVHARAVDARDSAFTSELLREWKRKTNQDSWLSIMHGIPYRPGMDAVTPDVLRDRLRAAAIADLDVFRRTPKWPRSATALTLRIDNLAEPLSTAALADAVTTFDDLLLVAPPGMGKTTTLFQIAEGVLQTGTGTPLIVPLGDWATEDHPLIDSVLRRPAFRGISQDQLFRIAGKPGVVLFLDGWNELDSAARRRATAQIETLKAQLPELGLVVSTRKQAFDVPFAGTRIDILPLNEAQQTEIAHAMSDAEGVRILDRVWRTPGIRDLVTNPLYLTTLLALPKGAAFPTTKEEVLRRFADAHDNDPRHSEPLRTITQGFQEEFLSGLAVAATRAGHTAVSDDNARRTISQTEYDLVANGQLTEKPQPNAILGVLTSDHLLTRAGDTPGYSFQHQQFQEWYASHYVERAILDAASTEVARDKLKAEIFNRRAWEEAVLFAVERLARGDPRQQRACGAALLAAFDVDPMFAAEMIFRATDTVWRSVAERIERRIGSWHVPGKVDRAVRFMVISGRPEFCEPVWSLVSNENDQIHLAALRAAIPFRATVLGGDVAARIAALPMEIKKHVLAELALNGGFEGLSLVTGIAKNDPEPEIKAEVVDALAFRRAEHHIAEVLGSADERTYDLVVARGLIDGISDETVQNELNAALRRRQPSISPEERMRSIAYSRSNEDHSAEVAAILSELEFAPRQEPQIFYELSQRYRQAVAEGLLSRLRTGRPIFSGAKEVLSSVNLALEDAALVDIALADSDRRDGRAEAAASVLGPFAVGRVVDAYLQTIAQLRDEHGNYNRVMGDRRSVLRSRLEHTPMASLITAIQSRPTAASNEELSQRAELLSRRSQRDDGATPFSPMQAEAVGALVQDWGKRMLASRDPATRDQLSSLATLASCAPSPALLPLLKRLLDDNLRRYKKFREDAVAARWRQGTATDEARAPHTHEYLQAFLAIDAPDTMELMTGYLADEIFGQCAATVLASHWKAANDPGEAKKIRWGIDFSHVEDHRESRVADPAKTCEEAEAIFRVVESLIAKEPTEEQKGLAVSLGIVAVRLPHGRRDATIQTLLAFASRRSRAALLLSLVLSGEVIDIETVAAGIAEVLEAARTEAWLLSENGGYEIKEWLQLFPFVNRPKDALPILRTLPERQREPQFLEEMIGAFANAPGDEAEGVLFKLAEGDPRFYGSRRWRDVVLQRGTKSAARRFIDLAAQGVFEPRSSEHWYLARQIGSLIDDNPELRRQVYELLEAEPNPPGFPLLARAAAENADAVGLLLLIRLEAEQKGRFAGERTLEHVVTEHRPSEILKGGYEIVPAPAGDLREKLLHMTRGGGSDDLAARYLTHIDKIRDRYGAPDAEPRHPDLGSGRSWPIMAFDPDAEPKTD